MAVRNGGGCVEVSPNGRKSAKSKAMEISKVKEERNGFAGPLGRGFLPNGSFRSDSSHSKLEQKEYREDLVGNGSKLIREHLCFFLKNHCDFEVSP